MRIGWLADAGNMDGTVGGAELTQAEFRTAAPEDVEIVDCPPGGVVEGLDRYVVHNCVTYRIEDIWAMEGRAVKYVHDVWPHGRGEVRDEVLKTATLVFCSPLHSERFPWDLNGADALVIPPPVNLDRFRAAAASVNDADRHGALAVGPWMNWGKAPDAAAEWGIANGGIEFFGGGPFAPSSSLDVVYDDMPKVFAAFQTFVHVPTVLEPFGRTVVEAWAAECQLVLNRLVGARYWIEEDPDALDRAGKDFWEVVTA